MAADMAKPNIFILPACNEQRDLPAALATLAMSSVPTLAIVVENGSNPGDRTYEYAKQMGAITLNCKPAKMRATQIGLKHAREHYPDQPVIHFADSDNLFPSRLVRTMAQASRTANLHNQGNGAIVFGLGAFEHGPSAAVDMMRNGRILRKAARRKLDGSPPMPYGANYALHIGKDGKLVAAMLGLDPTLFVREENAICDAAIATGATVTQIIRPSAFVFTRGDLICTREEWRTFRGAPMETKADFYRRKYPHIAFSVFTEHRDNVAGGRKR